MLDFRGPYRIGAFFTAISALLHLLAPFVGGFTAMAWGLALVGVIYLAMAWGLLRGWRWLAYLTFVVLFLGTSAAISLIWDAPPLPGWVGMGITLANLVAVGALFAALWKPRDSAAEA